MDIIACQNNSVIITKLFLSKYFSFFISVLNDEFDKIKLIITFWIVVLFKWEVLWTFFNAFSCLWEQFNSLYKLKYATGMLKSNQI